MQYIAIQTYRPTIHPNMQSNAMKTLEQNNIQYMDTADLFPAVALDRVTREYSL